MLPAYLCHPKADSNMKRVFGKMSKLTRHITMGYLLVIFPLVFLFFILRELTDLNDRAILIRIIPLAILLLLVFIVYLSGPLQFFNFWKKKYSAKESDRE